MREGGASFKETKQKSETPESKAAFSEEKNNRLNEAASKASKHFSDDIKKRKDGERTESSENVEGKEKKDANENNSLESENYNNFEIKELFEELFSDDLTGNFKQVN